MVIPARVPAVDLRTDPVRLGRDEAREAAEHELSHPRYSSSEDPVPVRLASWAADQLADLLDRASGAAPGGGAGLVALLLLAVAVAVLVRTRGRGPVREASVKTGDLFDGVSRTAEEHRTSADAHAAEGRWTEAVRDRLRAIVLELEEQGLLVPRPGRTVDETAREAGQVLPEQADDLRHAARVFDAVWYGTRTADADTDLLLRRVDRMVREEIGRARQARLGARHARLA